METVDIACKMPQGLTLEMGYKIVNNGVVRDDNYKALALKGWNSNLVMAGQPAELNPRPGITKNVPKDFWEAWVAGPGKRHPAVRNGLIYVIPRDNAAAKELAAIVKDARSGLEPLDPNKMPEGVEEAPVEGRPRLTKVASNR